MIYEKIKLIKDRDDVTLTAMVLDHEKEFLHEVKRPAILICPGGAYLTCSDAEAEPVALTYNQMGYHAFVLRYSTYSEGGPFPNPASREVKKSCIFPNPMLDVKRAMEYIIAHAEEWNVDTKQIAVCGFSAGAHNVGLYSVYWKEYDMPKPAAAILGYPLADYRYTKPSPMNPLINIASCGKEVMDEEDYRRHSIIEHVSSDTPPMFIWTTAEDDQLEPKNSMLLAAKLSDCNVPVELHVFAHGAHGLSIANEGSAITQAQVRDDVNAWVGLVHTWLRDLFDIQLLSKMPF